MRRRVGPGIPILATLKDARQAGIPAIKNFNYEWDPPEAKGVPATLVSARGRDREYVKTYSLKRVGGGKETEDEKD